jgi:hypothetical protein
MNEMGSPGHFAQVMTVRYLRVRMKAMHNPQAAPFKWTKAEEWWAEPQYADLVKY